MSKSQVVYTSDLMDYNSISLVYEIIILASSDEVPQRHITLNQVEIIHYIDLHSLKKNHSSYILNKMNN